jgi:hypothetical protein
VVTASSRAASKTKTSKTSKTKTVTVFIMAGDANVEGRGSVPELYDLAVPAASGSTGTSTVDDNNNNSTLSAALNIHNNDYAHFVDDSTGRWAVRDDVYVVYEQDRLDGLKSGPLTVKGFGHTPNTFGPDVAFGTVMGNILTEPVVIARC